MNTTFKVGALYYIKFLDHSVGLKESMVISAVGWCIKNEKDYAVFTSWEVESDDQEIIDNNHEPFTIIKSCIKKKRKLTV